MRIAIVGAVLAAALFFVWNACIPDACWSISIPLCITTPGPSPKVYPELASVSLATEYVKTISANLRTAEATIGHAWKINNVSSPTAGISISLTAPFDAAIAERFDQFPVQLPVMLETVRQQRFSTIGLRLASEAEFVENILASYAMGATWNSSDKQMAQIADQLKNIDMRWQKQQDLIQGLEKEVSHLTARVAVAKRRNSGKLTRSARHRKKSEKHRKKAPVPKRLDLQKRSMKQRLHQARIEFERLDRERITLAEQKHAREIALQRTQICETKLGLIENENRFLAALFESDYGKPDFTRQERKLPSAFLKAAFMARPLAFVIGPLLAWLLFRKKRTISRTVFPGSKIPFLGLIPPLQPETLEAMLHPSSFASAAPREALLIRKIAMDLFHLAKQRECRRLAFFGTHGGCGTSACAALVTAALANDAKQILLVDLHWARPSQHRLWWIPWATGATNWLVSGSSVPSPIQADAGPGAAQARVIAAGPLPPSPEDALKEAPWPLWFSAFPADPPDSLLLVDVGNASESVETGKRLASALDGIILVANPDNPDRLKHALAEFEDAGRPVIGIVSTNGALKSS